MSFFFSSREQCCVVLRCLFYRGRLDGLLTIMGPLMSTVFKMLGEVLATQLCSVPEWENLALDALRPLCAGSFHLNFLELGTLSDQISSTTCLQCHVSC